MRQDVAGDRLRNYAKDHPLTPDQGLLVKLSTILQLVDAGGMTQVEAARQMIRTNQVRQWLDGMKRQAGRTITVRPRVLSLKANSRNGTANLPSLRD